MRLSEAKKRYIGKTFRVKHAERGHYMRYRIEDRVGVCTDIQATVCSSGTYFRFRIEIPGTLWKWFSVSEIEPVE